jgi:hypothetical protein
VKGWKKSDAFIPRSFKSFIIHFFFFTKRKPVLKEKVEGLFLVKFFTEGKKVLLLKLFFKPLQGLRNCGAEPHIRKGLSTSILKIVGILALRRFFLCVLQHPYQYLLSMVFE